MSRLINEHPAVMPALVKEVEYFSLKYKMGESWYRSHFPTSLQKHRLAKKTKQNPVTGDSTPYYIFHPMASSRMKNLLPEVKLIVILRNPIDRAYSHYHHAVRRKINIETLSFEDAINIEKERLSGEKDQIIKDPHFIPKSHHQYSYLARGIYADQLENWFKYYDRNQFLFLTTEDFHKNIQRTLDQVFNFLGLNPFKIDYPKRFNVGNYKEKMNEDTRRSLIEYFKPHNERLYKLLQRDFEWDK